MDEKRRNEDGRSKEPERIRSYRDLKAWQLARELVKHVYDVTKKFPREELYGLTQQLRRAAVSVPSNIAEGSGRGGLRDYIRFLQTGRGSLREVETQIFLAQDLGYITDAVTASFLRASEECSKVLQGLISSLERKMEQASNVPSSAGASRPSPRT
ncbi:MAG: four helix bundle protein [Planctomycetota bacterium]|nr:four helix bundle protein [Planctomycetota bacterium]